jgi:hypothetical protein
MQMTLVFRCERWARLFSPVPPQAAVEFRVEFIKEMTGSMTVYLMVYHEEVAITKTDPSVRNSSVFVLPQSTVYLSVDSWVVTVGSVKSLNVKRNRAALTWILVG